MTAISELMSHLTIGQSAQCGALEVFALIHGADASKNPSHSPVSYILLAEALAAGSARVEEVSGDGEVPTLKLVNEGPVSLLALDGEELLGAKQNRILSVSILAPAASSIEIPVACVEQGRWRDVSRGFKSSKDMLFASARANKARAVRTSLAQRGRPDADQGQIWSDIDDKICLFRVASVTSAMADAYRDHARRIEDYSARFRVEAGQVGAVFALNGRIFGLDIVERPEVWARLFDKLVRSYALDAIEFEEHRTPAPAAARGVSTADLHAFMQQIAEAELAVSPAVGLGEDIRFVDDAIEGGGLLHQGVALHVSAFAADAVA